MLKTQGSEQLKKQFDLDLEIHARIGPDLDGLNKDLEDYPGVLAKWVMMEQQARKVVEELDTRIEVANAELYLAAPAALEKEGKKPTVEAIKAKITLHPEFRKLNEMREDARHKMGLIVAGRQVMQAKRDCMLARASNMRAEMDTNLYVAKRKMEGGTLTRGGRK